MICIHVYTCIPHYTHVRYACSVKERERRAIAQLERSGASFIPQGPIHVPEVDDGHYSSSSSVGGGGGGGGTAGEQERRTYVFPGTYMMLLYALIA